MQKGAPYINIFLTYTPQGKGTDNIYYETHECNNKHDGIPDWFRIEISLVRFIKDISYDRDEGNTIQKRCQDFCPPITKGLIFRLKPRCNYDRRQTDHQCPEMSKHVKGIGQECKAVCNITSDTFNDHHETGKDGNNREPLFLHTPVDMLMRMVVMFIVVCYLWVVTVFHDSLVYENYMLHAIWHRQALSRGCSISGVSINGSFGGRKIAFCSLRACRNFYIT